MLRGLKILVVLIILFFSGFKPAIGLENSTNLPEVYVYVDRISDITGLKAEEFMMALKPRLTQSNVNLEFTSVQNPFLPSARNTVARLSFDPIFDNERIIQDYVVSISADPQKLKEISPILRNEVGITVSLSSHTAVDTAYAMLLLAVDQCNLAIPIFTDPKVDNSDISDTADYNLATCYLLEENYQKSIDIYQNHLYMETPKFLGINLAWLYLQTAQVNKAFDLMSSAIETAKQTNEAPETLLAVRAQLYNLTFHYDNAITDLTTALELSPTDPALYTLRGQTYLLLYEWDKVAADYNKALELDPSYADAYFYRGVLYYSILQTGQAMYTDALADFQRYLELAPDGEHATEATRYATDIQTQMNALNN
ncbi:MAG: tetratricopeptide repeat protein [Anaerolineaceae bacterium]|nr:tetratricopeptide repeat protein [Anaerolineaceae bacterium]